jgi:hypothetical protein
MPTNKEAASIAAIFVAANKLSSDYAKSGGAENRRDQLIAFIDVTMQAVADLSSEAGADPLVAIYSLDSVLQDLADAFVDAIDAEEAAEPAIDYRQYSTLRVVGGSVA